MTITYDPTPWKEMTKAEKRAVAEQVREEIKCARHEVDCDSLFVVVLGLFDGATPH